MGLGIGTFVKKTRYVGNPSSPSEQATMEPFGPSVSETLDKPPSPSNQATVAPSDNKTPDKSPSPSKQATVASTQNSRQLPENAIREILIRLPVKDLCRFKCVCTDWLSLISSPFLISSHLNRSISDPSNHRIFLHYVFPCREPIRPDPSVIFCLYPETEFVGSINGLICVVGVCINDAENGRSPDDIWIWNPLTGLAKKLPLGKHTSPTEVTFAFCWDSLADDYKVVKIVSKPEASFAELWASNSDSWKEIELDSNIYHPHCLARVTNCDVAVKGFAYWIVMDYDGSVLVASFDMRTEQLRLISMPTLSITYDNLVLYITDKYKYIFGANWKENFALAEWYSEKYPLQMYHLWTMDGDVGKEVWTKKLSFQIDGHFSFCMNSNIKGKFVLKGFVLKAGHRGLTLYDMETQEAKMLADPELEFSVSSAYDYVGSLMSIKGFKPLGEDMSRMINITQEANAKNQWAYYNEILTKDAFNAFAWNQRYSLLTIDCTMGKLTFDVMKTEAHYALKAIEAHPENESPWTYLRLVCKDCMEYLFRDIDPRSSYAKVLVDVAEQAKITGMDVVMLGIIEPHPNLYAMNRRGCEHALHLIADLMADHAYIPEPELLNSITYIVREWKCDPSTSDLRNKLAEAWNCNHRLRWEDL